MCGGVNRSDSRGFAVVEEAMVMAAVVVVEVRSNAGGSRAKRVGRELPYLSKGRGRCGFTVIPTLLY